MPQGPSPSLPYIAARLDRTVRVGIDRAVSPQGISVNQYKMLSALALQPDLSGAQLARRAYVSPQSMSETLLALERLGLVKRLPDPNHGRILRCRLTAKGRKLVERCNREVESVEASMIRGMSPADQDTLRNLMVQAVRNLDGGFPERH